MILFNKGCPGVSQRHVCMYYVSWPMYLVRSKSGDMVILCKLLFECSCKSGKSFFHRIWYGKRRFGTKLKGAFYFEDFFKCMLESFNDLPVAILSPLPFTIAFHPLLFLLSQQLNDLLIPLPRSLNNLVRHAPPFTFMSRWAALQAFLEPMRCQPVAKELLVERRL